jgi:hypothetical protein
MLANAVAAMIQFAELSQPHAPDVVAGGAVELIACVPTAAAPKKPTELANVAVFDMRTALLMLVTPVTVRVEPMVCAPMFEMLLATNTPEDV